jgi:Ca2+-transporting ATPase
VLREPMFLLLLICAGIYLALGDMQEAAILFVCVLLVLAITIVQTRRTDKAVAALRDLSSPRALVVRGGVERKRIAGAEVVRGDLVRLHEGDRVPADGALLAATNLAVDESLLTGESMPVHKDLACGPELRRVFAGTLVVRGHGLAEIAATGQRSELGKIGVSLADLEPAPSRIQREVTRLVRIFGIGGAICCVAVLLFYGLGRGAWLEGFLAGITLAMSLLPEEFPLVLTVFLALGAWRLSRRNVLIRRIPALESLGAATTLCVDKTGTLTHNQMALVALRAGGAAWSTTGDAGPPAPELRRADRARRARQPARDLRSDGRGVSAVSRRTCDPGHAHAGLERTREYPLTPALLAVTHVWRAPAGSTIVASKGAPEAIAGLCHLDPEARAAVLRRGRRDGRHRPARARRRARRLARGERRAAGAPRGRTRSPGSA